MRQIVLYSKEGCCLCDQVREELLGLRDELDFTFDEIDIEGDADLYERYKEAVPVVIIDGWLKLRGKLNVDRLRRTLERVEARERARAGQPVTGLTRDVVISLDKGIFWLAKHWLLLFNLFAAIYAGLPLLAPLLAAAGYISPANAIYFVYQFFCHQLPSRSFFILGHQVAYCQRDTAIYTSMLIAGLVFGLVRRGLKPLPWKLYLLALVPMTVDGLAQLFGLHSSNWWLRTITGIIFGVASVWLIYPYIEMGMEEVRETINEKLHVE